VSSSQADTFGPYRILRQLGEGGMGEVYEAEQIEPVRRRVALKVMKLGMDTKEVVARFEAERQAMAVMEHLGIAKVLDAGASQVGRPYFVMELVKGLPLTEYCDVRQLSLRERIELFVPVCQAVQHAHQKGLIHRDLKPSNVLVMEQDGVPVPKVIDFGIAKAISQRLTDKTLVTAFGVAMGTPAYMSPEQAEMSNLDVDTRTDIYSLGVMLYELLVGELPVNPEEVGLQAFIAQLVMRETDPLRPSLRASTAQDAERLAALRRTDSAEFPKALRGDLDWIVLKAMDKDRGRRYETANGLSMDLDRYLRNEPVVARPPTARYRFQKFVRRNRTAVLAAAVVAVALVAGVVLATLGMVRATRAERVAQQEAETAREVSDFLVGLFRVGDPSAARGDRVSAQELLDAGAQRIRTELADRPLVRARLMATMGSAYTGLGQPEVATSLLEQALTTLVARGSDALTIARAQSDLAAALVPQGEFDRADSLSREALETFRREYGERYHPDIARVTHTLAFRFLRQNVSLSEGEMRLRSLLTSQQAEPVIDSVDLAATMDFLCWTLINKGDHPAADETCPDALALRRRLFPYDHASTTNSLHRLGAAARDQGRYDEALAAFREALAMSERLYGSDNIAIAWNRHALSRTFRYMGEVDSALPHARDAVRIRREQLADDNPQLAEAYYELATVLRDRGDLNQSVEAFRAGVAVDERGLRDRTGDPALMVSELVRQRARFAALLRQSGRQAEGRDQEAQALRLLDSAMVNGMLGPETPPLVLNSVCWWGSLAGHAERVLALCDAAVEASDEGNRPRIRDSRALARAMTGDHAGAAADFEAYIARPQNVAGVPQRRIWVAALRRGENPFTDQELDRLILP
jgi:tetratricopeptide (TPR) repeat protein/tRNA A-37 threonylcarbamoyl transferase component Bud32